MQSLLDEKYIHILHQTNETKIDEIENTLVSFFMLTVCRNPSEQGRTGHQNFKRVLP